MNDGFDVIRGAVSVRNGRIASVGDEPASASSGAGASSGAEASAKASHDVVIDAAGAYLLPGFVQTHVHLCQSLFRGYADDSRLMDWLRTRIWPMEAAHTRQSLRAAARLGCLELLRSGTTTALTMETVRDTDAVFDAVNETGMRATIGKCMMDAADVEAPSRLREDTRSSIDESVALVRRWNTDAGGRIRAAFAPRFALGCTRELLEEVSALSSRETALIHTHASEQREEVDLVRRHTGRANIEYFADVGLLSPRLCAAHCIWVDTAEQEMLAAHDAKVTHCPGSNLKLGSGIAGVSEMLERGICVSLGADGAACNNRLDMFGEMRLAALLQSLRHGPGALTARQVLWMATRNGARALGLERDIGSIETGKRADLILIDAGRAHLAPGIDAFSTIVYAAGPGDVRMSMVDGEILVRDGTATDLDEAEIVESARREARALAGRAKL